jgi:hypothetical protein
VDGKRSGGLAAEYLAEAINGGQLIELNLADASQLYCGPLTSFAMESDGAMNAWMKLVMGVDLAEVSRVGLVAWAGRAIMIS